MRLERTSRRRLLSGLLVTTSAAALAVALIRGPTPEGALARQAQGSLAWRVEVLETYPHDPLAHTEGLLYEAPGRLLESEGKAYPDGQGGMQLRSSLRRVDLVTGQVLQQADRVDHWAEGLAQVGDQLVQLSLERGRATRYDAQTFARRADLSFDAPGEGWGLCFDGSHLWLSDGSEYLQRRDAYSLAGRGSLRVHLDGQPLKGLNELECVGRLIYANLFPGAGAPANRIVVIDAGTGAVLAEVDAAGLLAPAEAELAADLNGIAYLGEDRFALTGKLWPKTFVVRFVGPPLPTPTPPPPTPTPLPEPRRLDYTVLDRYRHDQRCYTQGLVWTAGRVLESCGLVGESRIQELDLAGGRILRSKALPPEVFGEGITVVGDRIFQITWKDQAGLIWGLEDFESKGRFSYAGEGWGLCYDGQNLRHSDGSSVIRAYSADADYRPLSSRLIFQGQLLATQLNELECVGRDIWANVYLSNDILRIDGETGLATGILNLEALDPRLPGLGLVLNGIAYDAADNSYLVTGKQWPWIYRLRIHEGRAEQPGRLWLPLMLQGY